MWRYSTSKRLQLMLHKSQQGQPRQKVGRALRVLPSSAASRRLLHGPNQLRHLQSSQPMQTPSPCRLLWSRPLATCSGWGDQTQRLRLPPAVFGLFLPTVQRSERSVPLSSRWSQPRNCTASTIWNQPQHPCPTRPLCARSSSAFRACLRGQQYSRCSHHPQSLRRGREPGVRGAVKAAPLKFWRLVAPALPQ